MRNDLSIHLKLWGHQEKLQTCLAKLTAKNRKSSGPKSIHPKVWKASSYSNHPASPKSLLSTCEPASAEWDPTVSKELQGTAELHFGGRKITINSNWKKKKKTNKTIPEQLKSVCPRIKKEHQESLRSRQPSVTVLWALLARASCR